MNVTGDEVQTDASLPRVNDKKKAAEPDLIERVPDMKDADFPVLDINIAKKEVTFNEKENAIIDSSNIWNNSKKLYPKIYEKKLPEKKDDLIKSILNRRKDTNRADNVHIDTDQENEIDERDRNIRETLKELKNKIFKKLENQRKYYLKHRSHNTGRYIKKMNLT